MYNSGTVVNAERKVYPYTTGIAVRVGSVWVFENSMSSYPDSEINIIDTLSEGYDAPMLEPSKTGAIVQTGMGRYFVKVDKTHHKEKPWYHFVSDTYYSWTRVLVETPELLFEGVLDS